MLKFIALGTCLFLGAFDATSQTAEVVNRANRTIGPQNDGSIVASSNQTLTPAGQIVQLGSPVRAKALALNPTSKVPSGAVLLMGSPQPIIVFNTATGQVLQRFIPTTTSGAAFISDKTG